VRGEPRVSVVITTYNRPQLLPRAVRSALGQTLRDIEVIVVVDGPRDDAVRALSEIEDRRLRIEVLPQNVGWPGARNAGVGLARAPWIATLDDDDEWLPAKLDWQLRTAEASAYLEPIIACRFVALYGADRFVWPRRTKRPDEHISEYLFCRRSPFFGEGLLPSSVLFFGRDLAQAVPFRGEWQSFDDLDWMLRAAGREGVDFEFVDTPEPLMVWHRRVRREPDAQPRDWRRVVRWAQASGPLMTRRAYAGLLLTWAPPGPGRHRRPGDFWPPLREAVRNGAPAPVDILTYLAYWLVPVRLRRRVAALMAGRRREPRTERVLP
jgi:hypothetical protein